LVDNYIVTTGLGKKIQSSQILLALNESWFTLFKFSCLALAHRAGLNEKLLAQK